MSQNAADSLPTWRLWGEERDPDAIYTVYLKKVRYHRPTLTVTNDSEDEISHLEWETVRVRFVKAATLEKLVDSLTTDDGELETTFINVFFATYRTFSQSDTILNLMISKYETLNIEADSEVNDQHKKTLISALHIWLDGYPEDWNVVSLRKILSFTGRELPNSELHIKVLRLYDRLHVAKGDPLPSWTDGFIELTNQYGEFCLASAFQLSPCHIIQAYRFPDIPVKLFAEQLTRMDTDLFKRLIPHQCLGQTWARRDKHQAESVVATVNQFNAVLHRVITSILVEPNSKPADRAVYIITWIDIAQELRILKNFSSLKSIISALESEAIHRLEKTWSCILRDKLELFNELARLVSQDNNAIMQREVLMKEGTAKYAIAVGDNDRHLQKVLQKQNQLISHGTIPFLGTFLTDLTMIDTANPNTVTGGLINFDKRRKEFEILAQIKLLQGAANAYNIADDPLFDRWFISALALNEKQNHELSCKLEPPPEIRKHHSHKKSDSITSNSSGSASSQFYCEVLNSSPRSRSHHDGDDTSQLHATVASRGSSISSLSMDSSTSSDKHKSNNHSSGASSNQKQIPNSPLKPGTSPDFYVIRVTFETSNVETDGIVMYKSIMLGNNERSPQVILNAMTKLDLKGTPDQYTLSQILPDKEMMMPADANVYYALNTAYNLNFILRLKKESKDSDINKTNNSN